MPQLPQSTVKRRRAFFIHGFDPRSARVYHAKYRDQAALYVERFGGKLDVGPIVRSGERDADWQIDAVIDDAAVRTDYTFLNWGDLASGHLRNSSLSILREGAWTWFEMLRTGHWRNIWRTNRGAALLIAYPHVMIFLLPLMLGGLGAGAYSAANDLGAPWWAALGTAAAVVSLCLRLFRRLDRRHYVFHLLTSFTDAVRQARGERPETNARLDEFAARISNAADGDFDEVLVIGHSVGGYQALATMARALRASSPDARFSLLTLGQNAPFASFHPRATALRRAFAEVASDDRATWVDISSPHDWLCHILLDPSSPPDVPRLPNCRAPKVLSARLPEIFSRETLNRLRFDWFEFHFLYMYANEKPGAWDWFRTTAGPRSLADLFANAKSSPRADRMASPARYRMPGVDERG